MTLPVDRTTFKQYCLNRLGDGVLDINVSDAQVDDRIDDALNLWQDYHFEGTERIYFKYQFTPTDIANQYVTLPPNIIGAVNIFDLGDVYGMQNMFNIRYQIALNDLYTLTSVSMTPYFMALSHLQFMEQLLIGKQPIRYNRYNNILRIDMDWSMVFAGQFLIVEAYSVMDPLVYNGMWTDRWLKDYATALIKQQWGTNLKKYGAMRLPDGNTLNGQIIYDEATQEIIALKKDLIESWSLPATDMIG